MSIFLIYVYQPPNGHVEKHRYRTSEIQQVVCCNLFIDRLRRSCGGFLYLCSLYLGGEAGDPNGVGENVPLQRNLINPFFRKQTHIRVLNTIFFMFLFLPFNHKSIIGLFLISMYRQQNQMVKNIDREPCLDNRLLFEGISAVRKNGIKNRSILNK